ncbi:hypothetical protein F5X68DRAFT_260757 [Plectosphaerella plurivora]|uniref:Homeobox domain-containing protein n=1 Tax=Plectosphaerella plurivora TaxID=936078 RepID=A0A9P8VG93_9PEZI|nr:hypothetical protein F5X68DRAFT_260757 [Plectosphaerella plurivora]
MSSAGERGPSPQPTTTPAGKHIPDVQATPSRPEPSLREASPELGPYYYASERHPKGRRKRTAAKDKYILEAAYNENPKPDKTARLELVQQVSLNEKEVQIWFQNRRQNDRRKSRPLSPQEVAALRTGGLPLLSSDPITSSSQAEDCTSPRPDAAPSSVLRNDANTLFATAGRVPDVPSSRFTYRFGISPGYVQFIYIVLGQPSASLRPLESGHVLLQLLHTGNYQWISETPAFLHLFPSKCAGGFRIDNPTIASENESSGSAVAAISLLRSTSGILQPNGVKRNAPPQKWKPLQGKKPRLSRTMSSNAVLQPSGRSSSTIPILKPSNLPAAARSPSGDSDKENWSPVGESTAHNAPPQLSLRKVLGMGPPQTANMRRQGRAVRDQHAPWLMSKGRDRATTSLPRQSSAGSDLEIFEDAESNKARRGSDEVETFMRGGEVSPSKKGDMDCIAGLLSLSQGNWR